MAEPDVKIDPAIALEWLSNMPEQVNFAMSKAISNLMKLIQDAIRGDMQSKIKFTQLAFELRAIKISQFARKDNLLGVIEIDPKASNLVRLETAQPHIPINGRKFLPIPNAVVFNGGVVKPSNPLSIAKLSLHPTPGGGLKGALGTYTAAGNGKAPVIIQRVAKTAKGVKAPKGSKKGLDKTKGTRRLYTLVKSSKTPQKLNFMVLCNQIVQAHMADEIRKASLYAIKTARPSASTGGGGH